MLQQHCIQVIFVHRFLVVWKQLHLNYDFLEQVVELVRSNLRAHRGVDLPQLSDFFALACCQVLHIRPKHRADLLVIVLYALEHQETRDVQEYFCVSLLQLFSEGLVLFRASLNDLRKVQKLGELFGVHEVCEALRPRILKLNKHFHKFKIVFQLRVYNFNVTLVFPKQEFEVPKCLFDLLC